MAYAAARHEYSSAYFFSCRRPRFPGTPACPLFGLVCLLLLPVHYDAGKSANQQKPQYGEEKNTST